MRLADPNFSTSRPIGILIGGEIFFDIIYQNKLRLKNNLSLLVETAFGWIVIGKIEQQLPNKKFSSFCFSSVSRSENDNLQDTLSRFFDVEPVVHKKKFSKEELACEKSFADSHYRNETGRYTVSIPLREDYGNIGKSKNQALYRFLSLERKLDSDPQFKRDYSNVINEYLSLGHMKPINECDDVEGIQTFYMPHHAVIKPSSSTTKVPVVFDA